MLGRTPADLPASVTGQAFALPLSAHLHKRLCEAWPSSARSDLLLEPTSVLDIHSPSPSSTLSSSFAGSSESGPGSTESKAVAISGLFCEGASDGQFLDCTSFLDANEGQVWEIAEEDGVACEEDFAMGVEVVPSWQWSTEIWGEPGRPWEKISHWQDAGLVGAHENVEEPSRRINGGSIDAVMDLGGESGNKCCSSVAQVRENSCKVEVVERCSLAPRGLRGGRQDEVVMNGLLVEASGAKEEAAEGRLEACIIPYYQPEAMRRREEGFLLREVVQRGCGGGDQKTAEEWLPDWIKPEVEVPEEKVTTPLGSMLYLEEILLGSPAPPVQESWLTETESPPPFVQPQQLVHEQSQQNVGAGGLPQLRGGCYTQLDLHEAMKAALISGGATAVAPLRATASASLVHSTSGCLPNSATSASFSPIPGITRCISSPLPAQIDDSAIPPPSFPRPRQFPLSFQPHPQLPLPSPPHQRYYDRVPHHFPSVSSFIAPDAENDCGNNRSFVSPPLIPPQAPFQLPLSASSQHHLPRAQLFSLPNNYAKQQPFVGLPERLHRPHEGEFLQKHMQWHLNAEPGLQQFAGEHPFPVLPRSVPPESRQLQIPKLDLPPSRCVGKNVSLNELLVAGKQLGMAAKAAELGDMVMTQAILARLNQQNSPKGQPSQRAAFHFKQALARRLAGSGSSSSSHHQSSNSPLEIISKIGAYKSFCEVSPLPQFAHFTANQAILEAVEGEDRVHLIDFSLGLGGQWASFMQEISQRSRGPPQLRITTVGGSVDSLEMQLAKETLLQFARELNMSLDFHALPVARVDYLTASMLQFREKEAVTVNLGFGLDPFLADFSSADSFNSFLHLIKSLAPKVVTVIDNKLEREDSASFFESLQFYACLFESLESSKLARESVLSIENVLFAPKIASSLNSRQRMENLAPWRNLLQSAGFSALNFSKAAETHAEYLIRSPNSGFSFDKQQGSLLLGWHNKPLVLASAWAC